MKQGSDRAFAPAEGSFYDLAHCVERYFADRRLADPYRPRRERDVRLRIPYREAR